MRSHQTLAKVGEPAGGLVLQFNLDVSQERALELRAGRLAAIVESTDDALISLGLDGTITTWNPGAERLYGFPAALAVGQSIDRLVTPDEDIEPRAELLSRVANGGVVEIFEGEDICNDDTRVEVLVSYSPIRDGNGAVVGVARGARDVTEVKQAEREARFQAEHDPLTGLPNRRRLNSEVEICLHEAVHKKVPSVLMLGDLDDFKIINDALGHDVGDEFLRSISGVLKAALRDSDLLVRLGGDEFAILLRDTTLSDAKSVASGLCEAVDSYSSISKGRSVHATVSIGLANLDGSVIRRPDQALSSADAAMYDAKRDGRNRYAVAGRTPSRGYLRNVLQWSQRISEALNENRLVLYHQPILDLSGQGRVRSELLLRIDEQAELIPPGAFIPVAERYGMIARIDHWVIDQAIRILGEGHEELGVLGVNLSGVSFGTPALSDFIKYRLKESGVDPHRLSIEITETSAIVSLNRAAMMLKELQELGCQIGIDDFGSGTGSFTYLRSLPVDYLKLDKRLVQDIVVDERSRVVTKGVIDVAHGLGNFTVAEHVDSSEKLEQCRKMGIDYAQGFVIAKPRLLGRLTSTASSSG